MLTSGWQLQTPLDAIFFDCDGTLSQIEGIDALAALNGVAADVQTLTEKAMGTTGLHPALYRERLQLTRPRAEQMSLIAAQYCRTLTEDTEAVISLFQRLGKPVFILSAGLLPTILPLAQALHIPASHVFAVDIQFDAQGNYRDFDHQSVLTDNKGKYRIVQDLIQQYPRIGYIGDGLNDCPVQPLVTRFAGYGGVRYRETIAKQCAYYITVPSMTAFLPLTLTLAEIHQLTPAEQQLYQKGRQALASGGVEIREEI